VLKIADSSTRNFPHRHGGKAFEKEKKQKSPPGTRKKGSWKRKLELDLHSERRGKTKKGVSSKEKERVRLKT